MVTALVLAFGSTSASAVVLSYNSIANTGWFTAGSWSGSTWGSGDTAVFSATSSTAIAYTGTTSVSGMSTSTGRIIIGTTGNTGVINMSGGAITLNTAQRIDISQNVQIQGDFSVGGSGNGALYIEGIKTTAYAGTATVNSGIQLWYSHGSQTGTSSNFNVAGGALVARQGTFSWGALSVNSGVFTLGRVNDGNAANVSVTRMSGTGGTIAVATSTTTAVTRVLTVNQDTDTTFSGAIDGGTALGNISRLQLTKSGTGALTLNGAVSMARATTVSNGKLYINSSGTIARFTNDASGETNAILVSGGVLGGTGTINITGGDNVALGAGGALSAGLVGSAGATNYSFDGGSLDLSLATASSNTGWLKFDLGAVTVPGTTFDQIQLSGGTLNIGSGLNFSDFDFTTLSGFGTGTYVLFQTPNTITGSLGTATGLIGAYNGTLAISGNDLILNVIPEPSSAALFGGIAFIALFRTGIRRVRQRARDPRHSLY